MAPRPTPPRYRDEPIHSLDQRPPTRVGPRNQRWHRDDSRDRQAPRHMGLMERSASRGRHTARRYRDHDGEQRGYVGVLDRSPSPKNTFDATQLRALLHESVECKHELPPNILFTTDKTVQEAAHNKQSDDASSPPEAH
ncbi:unnamed protein product [Gongylonema pulchrum]|uniref:Uncharacterized protein n=1 Tax=Gongylonema pulchrum TaxID=637853 RepID=A0A183DPG1_9BILA|nr:unnamed protein product [Gongylonema pulchrum]